MNIQENQIIGELVAKDYRTASVFKKYGIDFAAKATEPLMMLVRQKKLMTN